MRLLYKLIWESTTELNPSKINVTKKEEIKGNSMTITLDNIQDVIVNGNLRFAQDQTIELFAKYDYDGTALDTSSSSPDLVFSGRIKTIKLKTDTKFRCTLDCVDRNYDILNRVWGQTFTNKTAPQIVSELIKWVTRTGDGDYNVDSTIDTTHPYTSGIQGKRSDGTDFPVLDSFGMSHKPIFEWLSTLSQIEYTNSEAEINGTLVIKRPMKYYIDRNNKFQWFEPLQTPSHYIQKGATTAVGTDTKIHRIISDELIEGTFEEINFCIYKAGEDMDNVQILDYELDPTAESLTTTDSFRDWSNIARDMKMADKNAGNITFVKGDEYDYPSTYNPLPSGNNYPAWMKDNVTIVTSDNDYNTAFRKQAVANADAKARDLFSKTGSGRWKVKLNLYGELFEPTELVNYTNSDYGISNVNIRIKTVTHSIDKSSFITTLDMQEDEREIQ